MLYPYKISLFPLLEDKGSLALFSYMKLSLIQLLFFLLILHHQDLMPTLLVLVGIYKLEQF
jgi:hypothetical protein